MAEKRFKQVVDGVKDTRTGRTLTHPLEFTLKLNEINDLYDCVFDRNEELEKENEQLKRQIGNLEHTKDFCAEVCADCERLEKENEQLKQHIKHSEKRTAIISGWLHDEGNMTLDKYEEILDYCYQEYKKGKFE